VRFIGTESDSCFCDLCAFVLKISWADFQKQESGEADENSNLRKIYLTLYHGSP
jgi:hypothetical protein